MSIFDYLFGNEPNPANSAMPYLNQIPQMEKQYYNPYIQNAQTAYQNLAPSLNQMASSPADYLQQLMQQYQPSREYQLARDEALRAAGNTAAAGGMRGSQQDIENEAKLTDMLMGKDMQQWLSNVLGIQQTGLKGEGGLYDTGFNATRDLSSDLANVLGEQAGLAFQGQREENQRSGDLLSGLGKALGAGLGGWFGGVPGAKIGASLF